MFLLQASAVYFM